MTTHIERLATKAVVAATTLLFTAAAASAQATASRFDAWIGCWSPTTNGVSSATAPAICVTPTSSAAAIEIATVDKGTVVSRDTLAIGGAGRAINKEGCTGIERAEWSTDGLRIYRHADVTCGGGLKRASNTISSISATGEWLDVESVTINGSAAVRATHYIDVGAARTDLPAELRSLGADRRMSIAAARTAAGGALDIRAVAEAVQRTDSTAAAAWIAERGARFTNLTAAQLVALQKAGVPGSVTDVMIGISYPDHFAMDRGMAGGPMSASDSARLASAFLRDRCASTMSIWIGYYDARCDGYYGSYGYRGYHSYYDYLYASGYVPYAAYGYFSPYGYYAPYYAGPVVIVRGDQQSHGQVVNGRGYRCSSCGSSGSTASSGVDRSSGYSGTSSSGSSSSSASSSSSGASSSSSGASSSSAASGDGGRTAHPRPPTQ